MLNFNNLKIVVSLKFLCMTYYLLLLQVLVGFYSLYFYEFFCFTIWILIFPHEMLNETTFVRILGRGDFLFRV